MTTISISRPARVAAPRGAIWAAAAAASLLKWLSKCLSPTQLRSTPSTIDGPADANRSRRSEAAEVRRMADGWRQVDPRFAADLYAAADRHER